ncbi:hypothetical protein PsYK624_098810 [Phanerochaete sordida]|uniref:Heterokaryon incompatibility domain-containing protein n=1 Tax=Phanerochaete sordida TaxID=48140 RepID=A0A9P3GHD4_9APHY|nr:hypothetical protein PsYK624_098810 [Phanerochaete sordida]
MSRLIASAVTVAAASAIVYGLVNRSWGKRLESDQPLGGPGPEPFVERVQSSVTLEDETSKHVHFKDSQRAGPSGAQPASQIPQPIAVVQRSADLTETAEHKPLSPGTPTTVTRKFFRKLRFRLLSNGSPIEYPGEDPPWQPGGGRHHDIPQYIEERVVVDEDSPTRQELNRMNVWGMIQLAESALVAEETLFQSTPRPGRQFTLRTSTPTPVPLQRVHVGQGAIPNEWANLACKTLSVSELLDRLNEVMGTTYTMDTPGLENCLCSMREKFRDFGKLYGKLRPWWDQDFRVVLDLMKARKDEVHELRRSAIDRYIRTSKIPPRRLWDLYSNRVVSFPTLPRTTTSSDVGTIPPQVWLVSHSWVPAHARRSVQTEINGCKNHVPVPLGADLDQVRIELLNMGAQYVWIDILCLKLVDGYESGIGELSAGTGRYELDECQLDVPSIGYLFRSNPRPCIIYFNGLGLPLDTSHIALSSPSHWLNRAWTLQETMETWLPGGLTSKFDTMNADILFARLKSVLRSIYRPKEQVALVEDLKSRYCSEELDRIACLAYIFGCRTLPGLTFSYIRPEAVWSLYIKHMSDATRTSIFLQYESYEPFGLWPSWQIYSSGPALPSAYPSNEEMLQLTNETLLSDMSSPGEYLQKGIIVGPCTISLSSGSPYDDGTQGISLHFEGTPEPLSVTIFGIHGCVLPDIPYILLGVGQRWKEHWVILQQVGLLDFGGRTTREVIKWGVFCTRKEDGEMLASHSSVAQPGECQVIYLDSARSSAESAFTQRYQELFEQARQSSKQDKKRSFRLQGANCDPLICDDAPWVMARAHGTTTTIPRFAEQRVSFGSESTSDYFASRNRIMVWGQVKLAAASSVSSTVVPEKDLFRSSGPGRCFTLVPSDVPMQRMHVGNGVVTNDWADLSCKMLSVEELLSRLNEVLGTDYTFEAKHGLHECLTYFLQECCDLGEVYGILRPRWSHDFRDLRSTMACLERDLAELRSYTLQGSYVNNYRLPPRRVWDLRSNRVLPFYCLPRGPDDDLRSIPSKVWCVSHSWVDDREIQYVWTPINARLWPVPIPYGTTLEYVRAELLNMGAEYVWLDVLCLRQRWAENEEHEALRSEEWKSDVPTIGYIYHESQYRPCITYFNGLGLALRTTSATVQSSRHWFNRAWTIQECVPAWLPAGLTGEQLPGGQGFFARVDAVIRSLADINERVLLIEDIRDRYSSKALDKLSGLGYLLGRDTLPLYQLKEEPTMEDLEEAWTQLVKHMHERPRTFIFLLQPSDRPFSPWVSWEKYSNVEHWTCHPSSDRGEDLRLVDRGDLGKPEAAGEYHHLGYATIPCRITGLATRGKRSTSRETVKLSFDPAQNMPDMELTITGRLGVIAPEVPYRLVGIGNPWKEHWIVIEEVASRQIRGMKTIEAIKWGVLRFDENSAALVEEKSLGMPGTSVVYLSAEDAQQKTKHSGRYLGAFTQIWETAHVQ